METPRRRWVILSSVALVWALLLGMGMSNLQWEHVWYSERRLDSESDIEVWERTPRLWGHIEQRVVVGDRCVFDWRVRTGAGADLFVIGCTSDVEAVSVRWDYLPEALLHRSFGSESWVMERGDSMRLTVQELTKPAQGRYSAPNPVLHLERLGKAKDE